jgi:hypothetical protein
MNADLFEEFPAALKMYYLIWLFARWSKITKTRRKSSKKPVEVQDCSLLPPAELNYWL